MVDFGDFHGGHHLFYRYAKFSDRYCKEKWDIRKLGVVEFSINRNANSIFFAKLWKRSGVLTDIEFYELRYSGKAASF